MAETMTYDAGTDTVTTSDNLNADEQDSLQVGEQLQAEQEQLLAGKYKNAEDLEKAYVELQKKLGEKGDETSETTGDTETVDTEETPEKTKEVTEDSPAATLINEASAEYYANDNKLSPETLEKFEDLSSKDLISAYLDIQSKQATTVDISDAEVNSLKNSVGGEAEYGKLIGWANENLDTNAIDAYDSIVETGNKEAIKLALSGLKSQYDNANGYEGRMLSGKAPKTSADVFRSQAEVVAAMSDARYDEDPAYRQDLVAKLDRSDIKF